jgi:hypothetical protein
MDMDPLSIAAASASLVATCGKLSCYIYTLIDKAQNVDEAIRTLGVEVTSLSHALSSIGASLSDPGLAKIGFQVSDRP